MKVGDLGYPNGTSLWFGSDSLVTFQIIDFIMVNLVTFLGITFSMCLASLTWGLMAMPCTGWEKGHEVP